ncbi:MAG TPA: tRNA (guanosine(46)-N7)-methyltransferase TrmB [Candidatus Competibacteraceae bacterium]|nr:tRNA (guanosine(46)-N7)-methyltransferase TrmB [Candidatus Competibacteraceae bacterium]HRZ04563.1 tRNA (guanosine(46)-N7)-methyltransferase TrmB [Candidatus Competibacteraceae bacterium]HSA47704.1 tRNA (guanosine(46)-N7)-methyltransferase TrmB [Candidatus Competibacteraceae bacterium]
MRLVDTLNSSLQNRAIPDYLNASALRRIHSFVRREGRMTGAQQRALMECWEPFGVEAGAVLLEPKILFGRCAPLVLEIGFGNGESLAVMAAAHPEWDYLGIEVHRPGIGHLLLRAMELQLTNLRILCADAVEALERQLPDECLDRMQIFFPDPWPKVRHHKRRLIQAKRIALLVRKIKPYGQLHVATDCEDYACAMLSLFNTTPELANTAAGGGFAPRPTWRPLTKFEQRGQRLGHVIRDLLFIRRDLALPLAE